MSKSKIPYKRIIVSNFAIIPYVRKFLFFLKIGRLNTKNASGTVNLWGDFQKCNFEFRPKHVIWDFVTQVGMCAFVTRTQICALAFLISDPVLCTFESKSTNYIHLRASLFAQQLMSKYTENHFYMTFGGEIVAATF